MGEKGVPGHVRGIHGSCRLEKALISGEQSGSWGRAGKAKGRLGSGGKRQNLKSIKHTSSLVISLLFSPETAACSC